jgi:HAE1 family hydrophobic/amphiphilic exporter-1
MTEKYVLLIKYALSRRRKVLLISISLLLFSGALILFVGGELFPTSDESSYTITVETPFGTSIKETDEIMSQIESYVMNNTPELVSCALSIGNTSSFSIGDQNKSTITVNLVDKAKRNKSTKEIADRARTDLTTIAGAKISIAEASMTSLMTASSTPIQIMVKGDDLNTLRTIAEDYVNIINKIEGVKEVKSDIVEGNPEVKIIINRSKAAYFGITSYQLANALESGLTGTNPTTLKANGEEIQISLSLNDTYGSSVENMKQILVPNPRNLQVTVGDIADFEFDNSPSQINRENQVRTIAVSALLSGRDLSSVSKDVSIALDNYKLPENYSYSTGGQQKEMVDAFTSLAYALLLSLVLVYMILASQFESLVQPLIIMVSIPFALTGAFIGLFVTNTPLSLVGFLGIIMLGGIVVNNSILLVDFINQNLKNGVDLHTAIVDAGRYRIRPIIMTMLTTSLALVPIALGFGTGGEIQAGMGITVIFGLLFSTFITLIIVPVIYSYVEDLKNKLHLRRDLKHGEKI